MLLRTLFPGAKLHRDDKFVSVRFSVPFDVLSTCRAHGGWRDDLTMVHNAQGCEPRNHLHDMNRLIKIHHYPEAQHDMMMERYGLEGEKSAGLGTAANMNNLAVVKKTYKDITVFAIATGGCESNAARAGDPASYYEYDGKHIKREDLPPMEDRVRPFRHPSKPGTINTILVVNTPMTPGAMVRAVMTATEAKTAVLQELNAPSFQSQSVATGTGTDQIAIAAPRSGAEALTGAGHHSVLGELIGAAVHDAIAETLSYQNMLISQYQCSSSQLLRRYGTSLEDLTQAVQSYVPSELEGTVGDNYRVVDRDPMTVSMVAALVHMHDQYKWGTIPAGCFVEAAINQGAMISVAASGRTEDFARYRIMLEEAGCAETVETGDGLLDLAYRAIANGYTDKWLATSSMLDSALAKLEEQEEQESKVIQLNEDKSA